MRKRKMAKGKIQGIPSKAMFKWQNANLGFTLLGLFYLVAPWLSSGVFNTITAMFGMMFLSIGILRAKVRVSVLGALFASFLGICYFFGSVALMDITLLWGMTIVLFIGFLIVEMGFFKVGPTTKSAKAFVIVPLSLLSFSLILAFLGKNPVLTINWNQMVVAINYLAVLLFSLFSMLDLGGWRVMGASTDKWIMVFAVAAIGTAVLGIYQGSLWMWS
jgi:hypothetical protein